MVDTIVCIYNFVQQTILIVNLRLNNSYYIVRKLASNDIDCSFEIGWLRSASQYQIQIQKWLITL